MTEDRRRGRVEERILQKAFSRGWLGADVQAEASGREAEALVEGLVQSGRLTIGQVLSLTREVLEDPGETARWTGPTTPPRGIPAGPYLDRDASDPGSSPWPAFESGLQDRARGTIQGEARPRYTLLEPLGAGGMAEVVKAYDQQLQRNVALKFLHIQHPALTERLLREARLQARVEHPDICRVYDAGELDGRPYIAFQLVDGPTLDRASSELRLEEKVLLLRRVAEAVHAAHRLGLIHRDLKPSNVLVEKTEDGWHPYVTDFGLAKEVAAPSLSVSGSITGTPHYMAPEQVRGEVHAVDRRTDVYGLGATLFELLCGRLPFEGDAAVDVMVKVLADEPPAPRSLRPSIPRDLDTIVLRCLEKDPNRRYESARALAEDLGRFLDGSPIEARRAGAGYRLWKIVRRNRLLAAVSAAALASVLILGGLWIQARLRAAEQARAAQRFGRDLEQAESVLRFGRLLPLHDTRPEKSLVLEKVKRIERDMSELGAPAQGPGNAAIGRALLALERYEEARIRLERAWELGYREPGAAYALGRVLGALYQVELAQTARLGGKELKEARRKEIEGSLRDAALRFLALGRTSEVDSAAYLEGLFALYEGRTEEAIARAGEAEKALPWLYEAALLRGDARLKQALDAQDRGDWEACLAALALAREAYLRGAETGHSDARLHAAAASTWVLEMEVHAARGSDPEEAYVAAIRTCDRGLVADPDHARLHNVASRAHLVAAQHRASTGGPAGPVFERGIASALAAQSLDASDAEAPRNLALAYFRMGEWASGAGQDPFPLWDKAVEACGRSLTLSPGDPYALNTLGLTHWRRADQEMSRGMDPRVSLGRAAEAFRRALAPRPFFVYLINLGNVYLFRAMYEMEQDHDPGPSLDEAIRNYEAAASLNPSMSQCFSNLGSAYLKRGEWQMGHGEDPMPSFLKGRENLQKAVELNPNRPAGHYNLHTCCLAVSVQEMRAGKSPEVWLKQAREALARALALRPGFHEYLRAQGEVDLYMARWRMRAGGDPEPHFRAAEAAFEASLKANPASPHTFLNVAQGHRIRAEWLGERGRSGAGEVQKGLAAAEKALRLNPGMHQALGEKGALLLARASAASGEERRRTATEAVKILEEALAADPSLVPDLQSRLEEARRIAGP
ncbi:MAG: protein kinase domain-containing protein [Acidobacteriota bacterium]